MGNLLSETAVQKGGSHCYALLAFFITKKAQLEYGTAIVTWRKKRNTCRPTGDKHQLYICEILTLFWEILSLFCKISSLICEILIQPRQTHTHIALCRVNHWSVSLSGACGSGGAGVRGPEVDTVSPSVVSPRTRSRGGHRPVFRCLCRSFSWG